MSTTVGVGGASLVSRALGARRPDLAGRAAGNSFAIFWATAVAVTIVGLAFLDPLLRLVGATAETLPYARPYATVIVGGAIFSTGFSALVRAEGRLLFSPSARRRSSPGSGRRCSPCWSTPPWPSRAPP